MSVSRWKYVSVAALAAVSVVSNWPAARKVSYTVAAADGPWRVPLGEPTPHAARYIGNARLAAHLNSSRNTPLALTSMDFDQDGYPDAVAAYRTPTGYALTLHRGNADAFVARPGSGIDVVATIKGGKAFPTYRAEAVVSEASVAPEFLASGYILGPTSHDVVAASSNGQIEVLRYNGDSFESVQKLDLGGTITGLAAMRIDPRRLTEQVLVGLHNAGSSVAIIDLGDNGRGDHGLYKLAEFAASGDVASFSDGELDGDGLRDVAVAAGGKLQMLHGYTVLDAVDQYSGAGAAFGRLDTIDTPFEVASAVAAPFLYDRNFTDNIAALATDGTLHLLSRADRDTTPFTDAELKAMHDAAGWTSSDGQLDANTAANLPRLGVDPRKTTFPWKIERSDAQFATMSDSARPLLMTGRVSGYSGRPDVLAIDSAGTFSMLSPGPKGPETIKRVNAISRMPAAAFAGRLDLRNTHGLVLLNADGSGLSTLNAAGGTPRESAGGIVVNTTTDDNLPTSITACTNGTSGCTLRAAITLANQRAANDTIILSGTTYQLTVQDQGYSETQNATGDLNPRTSMTIVGSNTTIQAGTASTTPISSIIYIPYSYGDNVSGANFSISGITFQYGLNNQPAANGANGGCLETDVQAFGSATLTGLTVQYCQTIDGNGGGIAMMSTAQGATLQWAQQHGVGYPVTHTETYTLSNLTVSHDQANYVQAGSGVVAGGGIFGAANISATMTQIQVDHNIAFNNQLYTPTLPPPPLPGQPQQPRYNPGAGGAGIYLNGQSGSNATGFTYGVSRISKAIIQFNTISNTSPVQVNVTNRNGPTNDGGGFFSNGIYSIDQSSIQQNTALRYGGGVYSASSAGAAAITNTTIYGNDVSGDATISFGGGIYVSRTSYPGPGTSLNNNRITANTIVGSHTAKGRELYMGSTQLAKVDATENFWGCNGDPTSSVTLPPPAGANCYQAAAVSNNQINTLTAFPYNVLSLTPSATRLAKATGTITLTADVLSDNLRAVLSPKNTIMGGVVASWGNAVGGSLSNTCGSLDPTGLTCTATFTPSAAGYETVTVTVDNATTQTRIEVGPNIVWTVPSGRVSPGQPFSATVKLVDPADNTTLVTGYPGTIHFASNDPLVTGLPADTTIPTGTLTFTASFNTVGNQGISATDNVAGVIYGASSPVTVAAGPAASFSLSPSPTTINAGSGSTFTITALDSTGAKATSYTGRPTITSSDPSAVIPVVNSFVQGAGTVTVTLKTAGSQTVTARDSCPGASCVTGTSSAVTVKAGTVNSFNVTGPPTATAGTAFSNLVVTALDAYGNTATGYSGTVHFTSSDSNSPVLPSDSTLTSGTKTFSATLKTAGNRTITVSDTVTTTTRGTSNAITVGGGAATSLSVSAPSGAANGTAFNFTVTAKDAYNNTATGYTGTVGFTSTGTTSATFTPNTSTLTNGVGSISGALTVAAPPSTATITATDQSVSSITGTSGNITVGALPATHFSVAVSPASVTAGTSFSAVVTALANNNSTATGYTGTVSFTSTDSGTGVTLPSCTLSASNNGSKSCPGLILVMAGTQTLTVSDGTYSGNSGNLTVNPGAAASLQISVPASATAGASFPVNVTAFDAYNNVATGYTRTVTLTSTTDSQFQSTSGAAASGVASIPATLFTVGTQTIKASDGTLNVTSGNITVNPAGANSFTVSGPANLTAGVQGSVTVTAYDSYNNVATGYAGNFTFSSSDTQAVLPGSSTLTNGTGVFNVTLKTSGQQTVSVRDPNVGGAVPNPRGPQAVRAPVRPAAGRPIREAAGGGSNPINVTPGAAASLALSIPAGEVAGSAITATVTAYDAFGNIATGYTGTVHYTSTDSQGSMPADAALPVNKGTGTASVTLKTAGAQTVTVTDTVTGSLTANGPVTVTPGPAVSLGVSAPSGVAPGVPFGVTVTAYDAYANVATGYLGTAHMTTTASSATMPNDFKLPNGSATVQATIAAAGNPSLTATLTATDTVTNSISGTSATITVGVPVIVTADSPQGVVIVNGTQYTGEQDLILAPGTQLTISAPSIVSSTTAGQRFAFNTWSDGGAQTHVVTVGTKRAVYTASFKTQWQLTTFATPAGAGVITPSGGYYDDGTILTFQQGPTGQYQFLSWAGDLPDYTVSSPVVSINQPTNIGATYVLSTNLSVNPTQLNAQFYQGTTPTTLAVGVSVTSPSGATFTPASGSPWIAVAGGGPTPGGFTVTLNFANLPVGLNVGSITVSGPQSPSVTIPVTVNVLPKPTLAVAPGGLSFSAVAGSAAQQLALVLSATPRNASSLAVASDSAWLSASLTSSQTPARAIVTADPTGLSVGTYSGSVTISSTDVLNSPLKVPVTLIVTAGATGTTTNGGSFASGSLAPNEIVSLFGTFSCSSTPQVIVNGVSAQVLGSTATQINFTMPQAVGAAGTAQIVVSCNGTQISTASGALAPQSPAIFTSSQNGSGQAAALNQDYSVNKSGNAASRGSYISLYVTGFGALNPASSDGLQRLAATVTASVGGVPASVVYAGQAPGYTLGLQQINIQIPSSAPSGPAVLVVLTVNGATTQSGVTISIQ